MTIQHYPHLSSMDSLMLQEEGRLHMRNLLSIVKIIKLVKKIRMNPICLVERLWG